MKWNTTLKEGLGYSSKPGYKLEPQGDGWEALKK